MAMARIRKPALISDDGDDDKGNLDQSVLKSDGKTDGEKLFHDGANGAKIFTGRSESGVSFQNYHKGDHNTDGLG